MAAATEERTALDSKECKFIVSRFPKKARKWGEDFELKWEFKIDSSIDVKWEWFRGGFGSGGGKSGGRNRSE